jgi:HlyD family secretion protein
VSPASLDLEETEVNVNESVTEAATPFARVGRALALACLAVVPLTATGCHRSAAVAEEKAQSVEVGTTSPLRKDLTRVVFQPGHLRSYESTPIYSKISGFALEPKVDKGDLVKKGELLVELYIPEVIQDLKVKAAKVDQAKADLEQAKEAAKAAKAQVEAMNADIDAKKSMIKSAEAQVARWQAEETRSKRLVVNGTFDQQTADEIVKELRTSEAKRDEAKANVEAASAMSRKASANYGKSNADITVAVANVAVAEAMHDQWRDWISYAKITAPYDGIVTERHVHTGHFLQSSNSGSTSKGADPLFIVKRIDIMRCTVEVPELDAMLIRCGDKASIHLEALPGQELEGTVSRTSGALDDHSRTLRVEIDVPNPKRTLLPQMYAHVKILPKIPNTWTLPPEAVLNDILSDGDRSYCFVVEEGKARKLFLQVGAHCDDGLQILRKQRSGQPGWEEITGKEVVVTTNNQALQDGQQVQLKSSTTP